MKINPTELRQIIKEEAMRLKKRMMLEAERTSILTKLQEMEEGGVDEAFLGMMGGEERARQAALIKQFNEFLAGGAIGNMQAFLQKAAGDNFGGTLSLKMGAGAQYAGKKIIIYTPKPTTMQKLAAGTSNLTGGGGAGEKNTAF